MRFRALVSCLLGIGLVAASDARANDSAMGGMGQDLVPERSTAVRMVSEDIRMTLSPQSMVEWRVHATYPSRTPRTHR